MKPRVLTADDQVIVSRCLEALLEDEFDVIGSTTDGRSLIDTVKRLEPDVIVADISMPIMNGLDAVRYLRKTGDQTNVVFFTMHSEPAFVVEALRVGARGYVLKQSPGEELIAAIHASLQRRTYLSPILAERVLRLIVGSGHHEEQLPRCASSKLGVLQVLAEGRTPEAADILNMLAETIKGDEDETIQTLGVQTTSELIRIAVQKGLVS
jgi:DNA-binding NarL/FixJ family response regulator